MGLINRMVAAATRPAYQKLGRLCVDPEAAQARVWDEVSALLRRSRYWGRAAAGRALADFPIADYETFREPLIANLNDRVSWFNGEPILFWAETGGSTGTPKFFPLTKSYRRQFQRTMPPFLHACATRFPGFADRPIVYLAELTSRARSPAGVELGYISNYNYRKIPAPLRRLYVFPNEYFQDVATFREWSPIYAAARDVSAIFAITPARVEEFWRSIWDDRGRVMEYLARGRRVRATPSRLRHLDRVFSRERATPRDLWPGLSVIGCWKTAACALQLESLQQAIGDETPVTDAIFSATEGWCTVPIAGQTGGVLHPGAHVVEFHEVGSEPRPESLLKPWELTSGRDYEIFLTTAMGLVRYRLHDVLRCTGFHARSPVLEFRRKAGQQISLGTTRVTEDELLASWSSLENRPASFLFAPNRFGDGLLLLSTGRPNLADQMERALRKVSYYYDEDRRAGLLKPFAELDVSADHPVWRRTRRAQEKPRVLLTDPLGDL